MKKNKIYLVAMLFVAGMTFSDNVQAQDKEGDMVVSLGAGYSLNYGFIVPEKSLYQLDEYNATPVYTGALDFASIDKLSVGLAASYQTVTAENSATYYLVDDVYWNGSPLEEELDILNIGVRVHYHFLPKVPKVDLYTGGRVGMNFYNYSSNYDDILYSNEVRTLKESNNKPTFQIGFGMRYYATDWLGLNIEGNIGNGPYSMLLGMNFKFGGKSASE